MDVSHPITKITTGNMLFLMAKALAHGDFFQDRNERSLLRIQIHDLDGDRRTASQGQIYIKINKETLDRARAMGLHPDLPQASCQILQTFLQLTILTLHPQICTLHLALRPALIGIHSIPSEARIPLIKMKLLIVMKTRMKILPVGLLGLPIPTLRSKYHHQRTYLRWTRKLQVL